MHILAAIYVDGRGCYPSIPWVDSWPIERDARGYAGDLPIVGHPPCSRWCRLAGLVEARWGHKRGDDGGCFAHALATVRRTGGVIEHPAYSDAWAAFGLARPDRLGGWTIPDEHGGRSCHVEQGWYGHLARKATWLYSVGTTFPDLVWGSDPDSKSKALVSWCGNRVAIGENRPRVGKREASATPPAFRDVLLSLALSVRGLPHIPGAW